MKRAYLVGQSNCRFSFRGQKYEYNFKAMMQKNLGTGKERQIRPPKSMKQPSTPLLPVGPMVVIKVPANSAGKTVEINDPNNKGKTLLVNVPSGAKAGQKMAVPVPAAGETLEMVQQKQKKHSTGAKLAMGTAGVAAVGGLAVGGVILGEHLSGGAVSEWATGAGAGDLGEGIGGAVEDATAWMEGAVADAGDWIEGAAEDAGDWIEGAAEDVGDWLGDAAEDVG